MKHKIFCVMIAVTLALIISSPVLPAAAQANGDGGTWNSMSSNTTKHLRGVWGSSSTDVFVVGDIGTILHFDGSTWNAMTSGTTKHLRGVWGSSSSDVFAVGDIGTILHFDGSTWNSMSSNTTKILRDVWGSSSSDVFAVGSDGTILHYDGGTWSSMTSGTTKILRGVWGSSSSDVFAVGDGSVILHFDGSTWSRMTGWGTGLSAVWGSSPSDVFAVGDGCTILHYDGSTWSGASSTAMKPLELEQLVWSGYPYYPQLYISDVWGSSSTDVFAVAEEGTVVHYDGSTWRKMTRDTTPGLMGVWGSSSSDVFAVGRIGTVLHYGPAPIVAGVDIGFGRQRVTLDVVITGTHFTGTTAVSFGSGITINSFTVDSPTQITANISIAGDAAIGARDVSVTTPAETRTLADGFTVEKAMPPPTVPAVVPTPTLTRVSVDSGSQGVTLDVVITGTHFSGTTAVSFGPEITVNSFTVDSPTQITANINIAGDATIGARDISVTTPADTATLADGFTVAVPPPTVTAVSIGSANQEATLDVVIAGTHFTRTTAVGFGPGITVNSFTADNQTQITTNISIAGDATIGARDISVTTPGGTATLAGGFTVAVPPPTADAPTPTPPGGGLSCGRSPSPQASGLGDLALLLGIMLVCFGLTHFRRR